jgi:hypothetical protein
MPHEGEVRQELIEKGVDERTPAAPWVSPGEELT